ncbi:hypothetical protein BKA70DRAFT_1270700 [Coprinopsis sp. MPI-PUGE-AT-0042]|nr:hypothetical protein BKA70DRAFT_1270700 [Coprinopsis sp. MPI-PUGE-AT-0042]
MGRQSRCRDHRSRFVSPKDLGSSLGCVTKTRLLMLLLGRLSIRKVFIGNRSWPILPPAREASDTLARHPPPSASNLARSLPARPISDLARVRVPLLILVFLLITLYVSRRRSSSSSRICFTSDLTPVLNPENCRCTPCIRFPVGKIISQDLGRPRTTNNLLPPFPLHSERLCRFRIHQPATKGRL